MNQSIYTEYANLTDEHKAWLDGCGATWLQGERFTQFPITYSKIIFRGKFFYNYDVPAMAETGSEFCERVAEILGIEKPVFGKSLDETLSENCHIQQVIDENSGPTFAEIAESLKGDPKDMPFNYPHRLYRVLDSLDGIPLDTRIPLSEWIPPILADVILIYENVWGKGFFGGLDGNGLGFQFSDGSCKYITDGHWMRIV